MATVAAVTLYEVRRSFSATMSRKCVTNSGMGVFNTNANNINTNPSVDQMAANM